MSDRCDVAGCEEAPALYGPSGRRCMAHVPREAPLRSDVPAAADEALYADGRFWSNPRRRSGEICFRGTRLPVASVQSYKGRGYTPAEVVREWADLLTEDLVLAAWAFPDQYVPTPEDDDGGVRRLRIRLAFAEIARAEAVRHGYEMPLDVAEDVLRASIAEARLAEVERVLTRWPWDGAAALRVLHGEPIVRERGETTTDEEMTR